MSTTAVITCMTAGEFPFICEAVQSVLRQTSPCETLLFVAEDNREIDTILGELNRHVRIFRVPLQPPGTIRNLGVAQARTEWVAFLDGDDAWTPEKIERQLAVAERRRLAAVGCRYVLTREDGTPFFHGFARSAPLTSAILAKRELLAGEPFYEGHGEDMELWERLRGRCPVATLKDYLVRYRVRGTSRSTDSSPAKRRKYRFSRVSQLPLMRPLLFSGSWLAGAMFPPR